MGVNLTRILELKKPLITFNGFSLKLNRFLGKRETTQLTRTLVFKLKFEDERAALLENCTHTHTHLAIWRYYALPNSANQFSNVRFGVADSPSSSNVLVAWCLFRAEKSTGSVCEFENTRFDSFHFISLSQFSVITAANNNCDSTIAVEALAPCV